MPFCGKAAKCKFKSPPNCESVCYLYAFFCFPSCHVCASWPWLAAASWSKLWTEASRKRTRIVYCLTYLVPDTQIIPQSQTMLKRQARKNAERDWDCDWDGAATSTFDLLVSANGEPSNEFYFCLKTMSFPTASSWISNIFVQNCQVHPNRAPDSSKILKFWSIALSCQLLVTRLEQECVVVGLLPYFQSAKCASHRPRVTNVPSQISTCLKTICQNENHIPK